MLEALFVLGVVGLLVALGVGIAVLRSDMLIIAGAVAIVVGFVIGVPAGVYYHLKLYRRLAEKGEVPRSFWLYPTRFHGHLSKDEWRPIARWFGLGAAAFLLIVVGCVSVVLGLWRA